MISREVVKDQIIKILKQEMNYTEPLENYSQWLMGVSVAKNEIKDNEDIRYTARMVTKTNQSIYVDGMDIEFTEEDGKLVIDPLYYENSPNLMGSTIQDSIKWMLKLNKEIIYLEQLDPHREELYLERLKYIIGEYSFETLEEYALDDRKMNLIDLYQDLLQETLLKRVEVSGREISDGKYELEITAEDKIYTINSKSNHTKEDVIEEIKENIIIPLMESREDIDSTNEILQDNKQVYKNIEEMIY